MPDYQGFPLRPVKHEGLLKSAEVPGVVARATRKTAREKRLKDAYAAAEERDQMTCRVTSRKLVKGSLHDAVRLEHHHLRKRSLSKAQREQASNIICVSAMAHDLLTRGWIACTGSDAGKQLFFSWTELATSKPLVIKRSLSRDQAVRGEREKC